MLVATDGVSAIRAPQCRGQCRGGRAECLEAGLFQQQRGHSIPRIGHDEPALALMEGEEALVELRLSHVAAPLSWQVIADGMIDSGLVGE